MTNHHRPSTSSLLTRCKSYLENQSLSLTSRKLYLSDIKRFLHWLPASDLTPSSLANPKTYRNYLKYLEGQHASPALLRRTLASLKQLGHLVFSTYNLGNPTSSLSLHQPSTINHQPFSDYLKHFTNYLKQQQLSSPTIKSYKSDIYRYLTWSAKTLSGTKLVELLTPANLKNYLTYLSKTTSLSPSTHTRKLASLQRFKAWYHSAYPSPTITDNKQTVRAGSSRPSSSFRPSSPPTTPPLSKPPFAFSPKFSLLSSFVFLLLSAGLLFFGYRAFSRDQVLLTQAYPTTPVTPNRQLSFQGRLEDSGGTPITISTDFVFKLFNDPDAGSELYSSGTCAITPDSDGVFSTQIGGTCGAGIAATVFSENQDVYLQVTVGTSPADEILDPRQQIATVAYALNAETLQGIPLSATMSAIANSVVPMNSWGEIIIGEQSPRMTGVSGTFAISAPALSLTTTSGSSGNISIAPDGTGQVNVTGNTTSTNFFNVANAQLDTGSLITGTVGNNNTGFRLLDLLSGSSPSSVFSVGYDGATSIGSTLAVAGTLDANGQADIGDGGDTITLNGSSLTFTGFNCTGNTNGGALTADGSGLITCSDDDGGGGISADSLDFIDFEDTLDLDDNLILNQGAYTWTQNFTGTTTTGLTYNANSLTTGTALSLASTSADGGGSGTSKLLNLARSGTNSNASHTAYGLYSAVTNTGTTSTNVAGYFSASGATNNYGLIVNAGNVGVGDTTPAALFTVGNGDLFQINSSGIIAAIDNVAHTIDDIGGNLTLTSNSGSVDIADDLAVNGATSADLTSTTSTATLFNTTVTTLSLGGDATTLNLGTTDSVTRAINLGTGTGADTINIGTGATGADVLTFGNVGPATTFTFNSGATTTNPMTLDFDTLTSGTGVDLSLDGLTTGTGFLIDNNLASSLTTGTLLQAQSVATSLTTAADAFLGYFNWNPGSATTAVGDLFRINIGSNGNATNLFHLTDNGSTLFRVSETQIESAVPHAFTAAGDVSLAYDLVLTNQTSGNIQSYGPLTIRSGESFENNNLTLATYGTGATVVDGKFSIGSQTTFVANDTTPSVAAGNQFKTANTGTTLISNFDDGTAGQVIYLKVNDAYTDISCVGAYIDCGTTSITIPASGDVFEFYYDGTQWNLLVWMRNGANNSAGANGVDIAEYFPSLDTLSLGEVVKIDPSNPEHVIRSASPYESQVVGVVSTSPGIILGENLPGSYPVALAGRVPVMISPLSSPIAPGDYLTTSNDPGKAMKSTGNGRVIGQALESWNPQSGKDKITVFINNTWYEPIQLAENGDVAGVQVASDPDHPDHLLLTDKDGDVINQLSGLVSLLTENLTAGFARITNLRVTNELISPLISADTLTVNTITSPTPDSPVTVIGDLDITGTLDAATVSARFAKLDELHAKEIIVERLTADTISANHIEGLDAKLATLSAELTDQELTTITDRIKARLASLSQESGTAADLPTPQEATSSPTPASNIYLPTSASDSASLASADIDFVTINQYLAVIGHATMTSLDVTGYFYTNSIQAKSNLLALQPDGGIINLAKDTLIVDSTGQVMINGDLTVSGSILADSASLNSLQLGSPATFALDERGPATPSSQLGKLLSVYNEAGVAVATIDASGSANLKDLTTQLITIASPSSNGSELCSNSSSEPCVSTTSALAQTLATSTQTNATAGEATLTSPNTELVIESPFVTADSLVYLTPTTNTDNKVLFVKTKNTCPATSAQPDSGPTSTIDHRPSTIPCSPSFTVAIDTPAKADIKFNWWIIRLSPQEPQP